MTCNKMPASHFAYVGVTARDWREFMEVNTRFATRLRVPFSSAGRILLVACLLLSAAASVSAATPPPTSPGAAQDPQAPAVRYLVVENVGQYAAEARFLLTQGNQRIWLTDDALWLTVPDPVAAGEQAGPAASGSLRQMRRDRRPTAGVRSGTALQFTFPGANPGATLEPYGRVPTHVSYLIGNDPSRWQRDVPVWSGVRYRDLYPGVDLVIGGAASGAVPWRLEARPGVDLNVVTLRVEGADTVAAAAGQLQLGMKGRTVGVALPAWSLAGSAEPRGSAVVRQAGDGAYTIAPDSGLQPGQAPDAGAAGVADAGDLIYSRFLGGTALDAGHGMAVDSAGNAYVTGETASANFPVIVGSYDLVYNGATDAFVAKLNDTGTALLYATYLGGTGLDIGWGIAVDGDLAYVVGETDSTDFPGTAGAVGESDIFVASLNAAGSNLSYASLLGGNGFDTGYGIAVAGTDVYVVGSTESTDLTGGCAGIFSKDLLVARLGTLSYTTCLGGSDIEVGYGIALRNEVAYVTGESWSADILIDGTPLPLAGENDVLVAAFLGDGTLSDIALLGGAAGDWGSGIAADIDGNGNGNIYIAGTTYSDDFPVATGTGPAAETSDAIVVKVAVVDFTPDFATYLGGSGDDNGCGIAVDAVRGLYVAGTTTSSNFPVTVNAYDLVSNGEGDVFAARIRPDSTAANKVMYATYLGGTSDDWNYGIAIDTDGHAFVTGSTISSDFPTTVGPILGGEDDTFVAKLWLSEPLAPPVVTIEASLSGTDAVLKWGAVSSASKYLVFRSSEPYFQPVDWTAALSDPTGTTYPDSGVLPQVNAYFYVVRSVSSPPDEDSVSSNRVGKFTFQLVPGN